MADYDRLQDLKAFDETKAGVKGLVDAGITRIPRIFIIPPEERIKSTTTHVVNLAHHLQIPTIDLKGIVDSDRLRRAAIVEEIRQASTTWGFFQVVNHGVGVDVLEKVLQGVVRFFEQPKEVKMKYYNRHDKEKSVWYSSNFDLYQSNTANWRDSLNCVMASKEPLDPPELPEACRDITIEYSKHLRRLGSTLFELLSEALGLHANFLNDMGCADGLGFAQHYYPPCPQPELTLGVTQHSDASFLTILLQDPNIGALQVLHQHQWVDVTPIRGALVVNIGDLLQFLMTSSKVWSIECWPII